MPTWPNGGKLQVYVKLEFSIQNWGKLQVKLEFCHVGVQSYRMVGLFKGVLSEHHDKPWQPP